MRHTENLVDAADVVVQYAVVSRAIRVHDARQCAPIQPRLQPVHKHRNYIIHTYIILIVVLRLRQKLGQRCIAVPLRQYRKNISLIKKVSANLKLGWINVSLNVGGTAGSCQEDAVPKANCSMWSGVGHMLKKLSVAELYQWWQIERLSSAGNVDQSHRRWTWWALEGTEDNDDVEYGTLKPCPHYRRKVRLSQKTARQWRQSHFSATVWIGFKSTRSVTVSSSLFEQHFCTNMIIFKCQNWFKHRPIQV